MGEKFTVGDALAAIGQFLIMAIIVAVLIVLTSCAGRLPAPDMKECILTIGTLEFRDSIEGCLKGANQRSCVMENFERFIVADCRNLSTGIKSELRLEKLDGAYLYEPKDRADLLRWNERWCKDR